ncbi:hypothetical protein BVL40_04605 [Corynebacterium diphtheriae]|nr:hypothetical protein BVH76_08730 [Corynebacterium diphtheriae]OMO48504.1 hypothetical protein BVL40_04605 [Corynebacterium diphtheriae]
MVPTIPNVALCGVGRFSQPWLGWDWPTGYPRSPPKRRTHTKSTQTAGFLAIWCEVPKKMLRNTPV